MTGISIVIPAYNRPGELLEACRSVACQMGPDDELVVSDDASPDASGMERTRALVSEFAGVIWLRNERNVGHDNNMRLAMSAATKPWLLLLGDDDALEPWALAELRREIASGYGAAVISLSETPYDNALAKPLRPVAGAGVERWLTGVDFVRERGQFLPALCSGYAFDRNLIARSLGCRDIVDSRGLCFHVMLAMKHTLAIPNPVSRVMRGCVKYRTGNSSGVFERHPLYPVQFGLGLLECAAVLRLYLSAGASEIGILKRAVSRGIALALAKACVGAGAGPDTEGVRSRLRLYGADGGFWLAVAFALTRVLDLKRKAAAFFNGIVCILALVFAFPLAVIAAAFARTPKPK